MSKREENAKLLRRVKNLDKLAEEELMRENMGLVKSISMRFLGRGEELEDLVQLGCIGLLKAARGYDESYGTAFSTYAVPMIIGEIRRFLRDNGSIKMGRNVRKLAGLIARERERYIIENGREPTVTILSEILGVSPDEIIFALDAALPSVSFQDTLSGEDESFTLEAIVPGEDDIGKMIENMSLQKAVKDLPDEERKIVELRYKRGLTQTQVGNLLGFTQVKISRMEKRIMEKLKSVLVY